MYRLVVTEGMSDQEVRDGLHARYGDFILYDPPFNSKTWYIWLVPIALGALALLVLLRLVRGARSSRLCSRSSGSLGNRGQYCGVVRPLIMMFGFFALALLALLFVMAPAFLRSAPKAGAQFFEQAEAMSRAWYEERLRAVEQETLDEEDKSQLAEELAAVLLAEYPDAEGKVVGKNDELSLSLQGIMDRQPGAMANRLTRGSQQPVRRFSCACALVAAALGVYAQLEDGASKIQGAQAILSLSTEDDAVELQSWQMVLNAWLADRPDDAPSWYLLGHAHLKLGDFGQAERAFAPANAFAKTDASVKLYWLQARYLSQQGELDALSKQLAREILAANPQPTGTRDASYFGHRRG